jgi:hypothetical protein
LQKAKETPKKTRDEVPPSDHPSMLQLDGERQRKAYNRKATLKQRRRAYQNEIIRRGIDARFTIKIVKEILRRHGITYSALNISKSAISGRTSLYIGIKPKSELQKFERQTRTLFTTDAYNEFRARHRL